MSETKPQKRLVSKRQYVRLMGKKIGSYAAALVIIPAFLCVMFLVSQEYRLHASWSFAKQGYQESPTGMRIISVILEIFFVLTLLSFPFSYRLFVKARSIQLVKPITDHNAHLLPAQESLLRGSDLPPTIQQVELLRAAQAGQETPQEELLRATTGEE